MFNKIKTILYINNILLGILLFIPAYSNTQEYNTFTYVIFLILIISNGILIFQIEKETRFNQNKRT